MSLLDRSNAPLGAHEPRGTYYMRWSSGYRTLVLGPLLLGSLIHLEDLFSQEHRGYAVQCLKLRTRAWKSPRAAARREP